MSYDPRMKTIMKREQLNTLETIFQFLKSTQAAAFSVTTRKQKRYRWVQKMLVSPPLHLSKKIV